MYNTALQNPVH
uniref:Uncharacterized protein n=1 Tax=Arundo donax TaxID=35708 RepID=A0A0A9AF30_ARUDO